MTAPPSMIDPNFGYCPFCRRALRRTDPETGRCPCGNDDLWLMHPDRYLYCACGTLTPRDQDCRGCGRTVETLRTIVRAYYATVPWPETPITASLRAWAKGPA